MADDVTMLSQPKAPPAAGQPAMDVMAQPAAPVVEEKLMTAGQLAEQDAGGTTSVSPDTPFFMHPKFVRGQLFFSSVVTPFVANMMYNPSIGPVIRALMGHHFVLVQVPEEYHG